MSETGPDTSASEFDAQEGKSVQDFPYTGIVPAVRRSLGLLPSGRRKMFLLAFENQFDNLASLAQVVKRLPEYRFDILVQTREPTYFSNRVRNMMISVKRETEREQQVNPGASRRIVTNVTVRPSRHHVAKICNRRTRAVEERLESRVAAAREAPENAK